MRRCIILLLLVGLATGCAQMEGKETSSPGSSPVVVELYTSQGCSSCPPADRLLAELAEDPDLADIVIPLSFHVAYWNYLGWRDPFSSEQWTNRQRDYSRAIGVDVYTPQTVVNGRKAMVGSRERDVRSAILEESRREQAVRLSIERSSIREGRLYLDLTTSSSEATLWVALWESDLVTDVPRGENGGRTLTNDRVVRRLERVGMEGGEKTAHVEIDLDPSWKTNAIGVAAFAQDPETMEIVGAVRN